MGLFDWLRPAASNVRTLPDAVWLTKEAKLAGVLRAVNERFANRNAPLAILLVAHFEDCFLDLQESLAEQPIEQGRVLVVLADRLGETDATFSGLRESDRVDLIVAERHPLPAHDEAVLAFARKLPCRCELAHHLSLEDPLMQNFAGEWVRNLLKRLGMSEHESIDSAMIAKRLLRAQQKIAQQAQGDAPARSAAEWFEKNCPPRG